MKYRPVPSRAIAVSLLAVVGAILYACVSVPKYVEVAAPKTIVQTYHYQADIQQIFDDKCAACHGCYDAPCQLKLSSDDGVARGASKIPVYDGTRVKELAPTRLGIDALTPEAWREKGFYSALYSPAPENAAKNEVPVVKASLIGRMIALGHSHPWPANTRLPDDLPIGFDRENACPTLEEFDGYAKKRPDQGMPLAVSGLSETEFATINTWLDQGAVVEPSPLRATAAELTSIENWERYLNRPGTREQLVARYLYEHLFIAHLYFSDETKHSKTPHFFELLRSRTPRGEDLLPVATVQPNEDAGPEPYYYRFRLISDTIVEKSHIIYALNDARRQRYDQLFFGKDWTTDTLPGYSEEDRANPFLTFAAIPAKARYQFLLDNAEYFVRSFIRGPVCAGANATNVINDQFWTLFEDPASERYVNDPDYRQQVSPLLGLPGQNSDLLSVGIDWENYKRKRNEYQRLRQEHYAQVQKRGPRLDDLWDGDGNNRDALLTIFRNYDNASVRRGLLGTVPQTIWVMDYPLLERSYYELVVNFKVFGNVSHQLKTRLYFDLIRNGAETNFLRFMPPKARNELLHQWYANSGKVKLFTTYVDVETKVPTRIPFKTDDPKTEFAQQVYTRMSAVMGPADVLNRCAANSCALPNATAATQKAERALRLFAGKTGAQMPAITLLPEVTLLRVSSTAGERNVYSLMHNRAHSNVAFIAAENLRLEPERDTLTVLPGVLGSYPNFIFDVPLADIEAFSDSLAAVKTADDLTRVVDRWGVRRTHPDFWAIFHDFTQYQRETEPLEAGLLDMNRYANL